MIFLAYQVSCCLHSSIYWKLIASSRFLVLLLRIARFIWILNLLVLSHFSDNLFHREFLNIGIQRNLRIWWKNSPVHLHLRHELMQYWSLSLNRCTARTTLSSFSSYEFKYPRFRDPQIQSEIPNIYWSIDQRWMKSTSFTYMLDTRMWIRVINNILILSFARF